MQQASLAQCYDIEINGKGVRELPSQFINARTYEW